MPELWDGAQPASRGARVYASVAAAGSRLLAAALPPLCPGCREPLADKGGVCARCWSALSFITRPFCDRLGTPFPHDAGMPLLSPQAVAHPPAYRRARAVLRYDENAGALVHALKYGDRLDLAPAFGRWMAAAGRELLLDAEALVPVPLHRRRLWARRFNQSAALAQAIGALAARPVWHDVLRRVKHTPQQVGLSREERARNVARAFGVPDPGKGEVRGRRLLLVDDVLTSGATVEACARALGRAGAASVDVLVFARVVAAPPRPI